MKASEYKAYKGIRKGSLRDNMTDIEVLLTDLGALTAREVAKNTRDDIENKLGEKVVTSNNNLNYQYEYDKLIENK